jgi:hypothetical protein
MRSRSAANRADSSPPVPARISMKGVARVVGIARQQQALQLGVELGQLGLGAGDFVLRHVRHVRVGQHLARGGQVGLALHRRA